MPGRDTDPAAREIDEECDEDEEAIVSNFVRIESSNKVRCAAFQRNLGLCAAHPTYFYRLRRIPERAAYLNGLRSIICLD